MEQVQQLVGIAPWTFIATICNLLIQMYLVKRFLFKPINEVLAKRQELADAQIREANVAKQQADTIKSEYEANMAIAKEKANKMIAAAQKTATHQSEEILKQATAQATAIKAKAELDIAQEKRKVMSELQTELGDIALELAEKVIEREISAEDHANLIDEFISNIGGKL